jgi:hypothetical protein
VRPVERDQIRGDRAERRAIGLATRRDTCKGYGCGGRVRERPAAHTPACARRRTKMKRSGHGLLEFATLLDWKPVSFPQTWA